MFKLGVFRVFFHLFIYLICVDFEVDLSILVRRVCVCVCVCMEGWGWGAKSGPNKKKENSRLGLCCQIAIEPLALFHL